MLSIISLGNIIRKYKVNNLLFVCDIVGSCKLPRDFPGYRKLLTEYNEDVSKFIGIMAHTSDIAEILRCIKYDDLPIYEPNLYWFRKYGSIRQIMGTLRGMLKTDTGYQSLMYDLNFFGNIVMGDILCDLIITDIGLPIEKIVGLTQSLRSKYENYISKIFVTDECIEIMHLSAIKKYITSWLYCFHIFNDCKSMHRNVEKYLTIYFSNFHNHDYCVKLLVESLELT